MFGEHRNMQNYIDSLERLGTMDDEIDEIWPSHADFPVYPDCIEKLRDGARKILNREVAGKPAKFFNQDIVVYDLGFTTFLCDQ